MIPNANGMGIYDAGCSGYRRVGGLDLLSRHDVEELCKPLGNHFPTASFPQFLITITTIHISSSPVNCWRDLLLYAIPLRLKKNQISVSQVTDLVQTNPYTGCIIRMQTA